MNTNQKELLTLIFRFLVSGLFILSALAKLLPFDKAIYGFSNQLIQLGITDACFAPLLARAIVVFELFLGIALLQNHYIKKFIIPVAIALLFAFCVHLTITMVKAGNTGNCGCFGELIPMTPLEALIKNIISIGLLIYIQLHLVASKQNLHRYLFLILGICGLFVFLADPPKCPCGNTDNAILSSVSIPEVIIDSIPADSTKDSVIAKPGQEKTEIKTVPVIPKDTVVKPIKKERPKVVSEFSPFNKFGNQVVDLNAGRKIIAVFNLDCDHCKATAKVLNELKAEVKGFPPVYVLADGSENEAEKFFTFAGGVFPYAILQPQFFYGLLGKANAPPRLVVLDNGNIIAEFINFETPDKAGIKKAALQP